MTPTTYKFRIECAEDIIVLLQRMQEHNRNFEPKEFKSDDNGDFEFNSELSLKELKKIFHAPGQDVHVAYETLNKLKDYERDKRDDYDYNDDVDDDDDVSPPPLVVEKIVKEKIVKEKKPKTEKTTEKIVKVESIEKEKKKRERKPKS